MDTIFNGLSGWRKVGLPGAYVAYALSNWTALTESAGSGLLGPDNKTAQRAMRPMPISRSD